MTEPLLTLEPLIDAISAGVVSRGWELSGLQKTTSTAFEGRWEGDSTRSAYLFFHHDRHEDVSVDVYLDETSQGVQGNLALVLELRALSELPPVPEVLESLADLAASHLPEGYRTPVTLRLRLADAPRAAERAALEARIKLSLPKAALTAGASAIEAVAGATVDAYLRLLSDPDSVRVRSDA